MPIKSKINVQKLITIGLLALSLFLVFYNLIIVPRLIIDVTSNTAGNAQLFYKINAKGSYSELFTEIKKIEKGEQNIEYSLPYYNDLLRWDPTDTSFSLEINRIYINVTGIKVPLEFESISASNQIENIINKNNKITIESFDDAKDPQIFLTLDTKRIEFYRISLSLIFTLMVSIGMGIFFIYRNTIINIEQEINNYLKNIDINSFHFKQLAILTAIGIFLHIFEVSTFMLSIDDEYSAFRINPEAWIADGRWTGYLIEGFIFPQPTMPYIPNLVSCFFIALSFMLIVRSHHLQSDWKIYITYPIFAAFPTLWFINEFYGNIVMVAFGFFLTSLSIYLFSKENSAGKHIKLSSVLLPGLLLAIAIGSYQSFIMLFIAMGAGSIIARHYLFDNEKKSTSVFLSLSNLGVILFFGIFSYGIINAFFKYLFPSSGRAYVDNFLRLNELLQTPLDILMKVLNQMYAFYTGSAETYGVSIFAIGLIFILSGITLLFKKTSIPKYQIIGLWMMLLLSPFMLHFITGANYLPTRSMVAIPYVIWMMSIILLGFKSPSKVLLALSIILLSEIQILSTNGQYAAAASLAQAHDKMMADDLYRRIAESNPKYDRTKASIIDVYGWKDFKTIYPSPASSTMGASFFNWDQGNVSRMLAFMQLLGYENLQALDRAKCKTFNEEFKKMPIWPAKDSVKFIDDVYLIKLGNTPDIAHKD